MTTLENTISIIKILPEADLAEIQNFAQKLLQRHNAKCFLPPKSKEDIYQDLKVSRQQTSNQEYQNVVEFIAEVRNEYGL